MRWCRGVDPFWGAIGTGQEVELGPADVWMSWTEQEKMEYILSVWSQKKRRYG